MRRVRIRSYLAPLFSWLFLVSIASTAPQAQPAPPSGSVGAAAPGDVWWMCRLQDPKDPEKPVLGSRMYYAVFTADAASNGPNGLNTHFNAYVQQNYKIHADVSGGKGFCVRVSNDAATRANSMDMFLKQWAASNIESIHVDWTNAPAQDASTDAKSASAAATASTAAATPTAAANQNYVWCHSAWEGTTGTMMPAGTMMYFSDVFAAVTQPQQESGKGGNGGNGVNAVAAFQTPFFAFLQKKYGFKNAGNYPVTCSISDPPTAAGLQNAQKNKQDFEDLAKQNRGQIVETGWKNQ